MGWHYGQKENKSHCCARQPQCSTLHSPDSAAWSCSFPSKGMGLQYWYMIMQGLMLQGYVDSFYTEITVTYYLGLPCHLNPIEHIWDYLGRKVRGKVHNLRDLENALIQEWNNIPHVVIRRYARSMRGRLAACINSRGGHTRYWLQ